MIKNESTEDKLVAINNFFKRYENSITSYQLCEVCLKPKSVIICEICKYLKEIPITFSCYQCKDFQIGRKGHSSLGSESTRHLVLKKRKKEFIKIIESKQPINSDTSNTEQPNSNSGLEKRIIKHRKKRINNLDDTLYLKSDRKSLLSFDNLENHYKRKKIKVGVNHNIAMEEYYDKIENQIDMEEYDYERKDMQKVWSESDNPLTETEMNEYLNTARIFWNYRNLNVENDLCCDFFFDLENYLADNRAKLINRMNILTQKVMMLRKFLKRGITLTNHFDEVALKILHICKYKRKLALLFLYKGINPFLEEIEEGFKSDVVFYQKEILSILTDEDL